MVNKDAINVSHLIWKETKEDDQEASQSYNSIWTASANSTKIRGIRPRIYIEDLLW